MAYGGNPTPPANSPGGQIPGNIEIGKLEVIPKDVGNLVEALTGSIGIPAFKQTPTPPAAPTPAAPGSVDGNVNGESSRPSGVAAQMESSGSPLTASCFTADLLAGQTVTARDTEIPARLDLCFHGFADGKLEVQIRRPDGRLRPASPVVLPVAYKAATWNWVLPIDDEPGDYTVIATQGALRATATVRITPASTPNLVIWPKSGPPGAVFYFYLAGFPANQSIRLNVYRPVECDTSSGISSTNRTCWAYHTALAVRTGANGRGYYALTTRSTDPAQSYHIIADHPTRSDDPWANFYVAK
jgi:hypothetical protein